jgi:L,D-transpeptidase catalytic domain
MWQRFVRWFSPETRGQRVWHIAVTALGIIAVLVLVGDGVYGLFTHINQSNALNAKARLDSAITDATTRTHIPASLIAPIQTQEQQATAANDGSLAGWQTAYEKYTQLDSKVTALVTMPSSQVRDLAQQDLAKFQAGVAGMQQAKYPEAAGYQDRFQQAQSSFDAAKSSSDYFQVAGFAQDQVAAIAAYEPTAQLLQQLNTLVTSEQKLLQQVTGARPSAQLLCADGVGSTPEDYWTVYHGLIAHPAALPGSQPLEAQWLTQDQALFKAASSSKDYDLLNQQLNGQIAQIQAANAALVPTVAASYLSTFKANIQTLNDYNSSIPAIKDAFTKIKSLSTFLGSSALKIYGWSASDGLSMVKFQDLTSHISTYQSQYDQDTQLLANQTYGDYAQAVKQIQTHIKGMQFDLTYAKTYLDIKKLTDLIAQGMSHKTLNNKLPGNDGVAWPDAFEYVYQGTGIGDIINPHTTKIFGLGRLYAARTTTDYQYIDRELQMFIQNLTAMLKNLDDTTPHNQVHQTDIDLMQYYGIMRGKVLVFSLREQTARIYQDGQLVRAFSVTTGAPDLPSAPGINCTSGAQLNQLMVSPDPPGSPDYYTPTLVKYGIYYHNYGLEIHDAWWRDIFGPMTNLPHRDPAAFNRGSHGCINIPKEVMPWLFSWVNYQNLPALVY